MLYLTLSILCASLISIVFKWHERLQVKTFQAIVVNYLTCSILGFLLSTNISDWIYKPWFFVCVAMGGLFIGIFFCMGYTARNIGVSVNAAASKVGVIIPVLYATFILKEKSSAFLWPALAIAILSVILVSIKKENNNTKLKIQSFIFPLIVFLGSGLIDTILKVIEHKLMESGESASGPATVIFASAFLFGLVILLFTKQPLPSGRDALGGIALGIPNYFSIFFLLSALKFNILPAQILYPINNVSIVIVATIFSMVLFKEKLSLTNTIGIVLAAVSLLMLYL